MSDFLKTKQKNKQKDTDLVVKGNIKSPTKQNLMGESTLVDFEREYKPKI